jgi:hypothetical protein
VEFWIPANRVGISWRDPRTLSTSSSVNNHKGPRLQARRAGTLDGHVQKLSSTGPRPQASSGTHARRGVCRLHPVSPSASCVSGQQGGGTLRPARHPFLDGCGLSFRFRAIAPTLRAPLRGLRPPDKPSARPFPDARPTGLALRGDRQLNLTECGFPNTLQAAAKPPLVPLPVRRKVSMAMPPGTSSRLS